MNPLVISKNFTVRDDKSLNKYFNDLEKIELISPNEEAIIARKIVQGDMEALHQLIKSNLRFVVSVAKQYQNQGLSLCDLINEGNMGLIIAAGKYDESRGFRFISYAVWWIRQSMVMAIAEHARTVRLPYSQLKQLSKLLKVSSALEQTYQRKPYPEELAEHMALSVEQVSELLSKASANQLSLNEQFSSGEDNTLLDILPNSEPGTDCYVNQDSVKKEIQISLKVLGKRERDLLVMYFGLGTFSPLSAEEISKKFNITKEHVGRLKEKALSKLRKCSYAPVLMSLMS